MAFSEIMLTEAPVSTNIFTETLSTEKVTKRHDRIEFILKLGHFNPSLLKFFSACFNAAELSASRPAPNSFPGWEHQIPKHQVLVRMC